MIQICYAVSKTITTVTVKEEDSQKVNYSQFQISATKYSATKSQINKISSQDVDLVPSEDFLKFNKNDVDVLVNKYLLHVSKKFGYLTLLLLLFHNFNAVWCLVFFN